jgi:prolyl-tRNA editing enzyme YbaK/EbsC (Cys-tRNA(Pro) deacylase)
MQTTRLGVLELQEFIRAHDIPGEIIHLNVPTPTVETAALAVNTLPEQIIKSILFMVGGQPVLAIACGTSVIGRRVIADLYGVGKKRVKLAMPAEVLEISGYEVGAMPPFGHHQPLTTLIDPRVLDLSGMPGWSRKRPVAPQPTRNSSGYRSQSIGSKRIIHGKETPEDHYQHIWDFRARKS